MYTHTLTYIYMNTHTHFSPWLYNQRGYEKIFGSVSWGKSRPSWSTVVPAIASEKWGELQTHTLPNWLPTLGSYLCGLGNTLYSAGVSLFHLRKTQFAFPNGAHSPLPNWRSPKSWVCTVSKVRRKDHSDPRAEGSLFGSICNTQPLPLEAPCLGQWLLCVPRCCASPVPVGTLCCGLRGEWREAVNVWRKCMLVEQ